MIIIKMRKRYVGRSEKKSRGRESGKKREDAEEER